MADDLKIFISWSGSFAKAVAAELREWLGTLTDRIDPWMSDVDIEAGSRSMDELSAELNGTSFGIVVVTQENQRAPWLNFEAGALSKQVGGSKARVVPLLIDMTTPNDLTGPLSQYQAQLFNKSGVSKTVQAIAALAGVDKVMIQKRLEMFWPGLQDRIAVIMERNLTKRPVEPIRGERELLDETLTRVRAIERRVEELANGKAAVPSTEPSGLAGFLRGLGIRTWWVNDGRILVSKEDVDPVAAKTIFDWLSKRESALKLAPLEAAAYERFDSNQRRRLT